MCSNNNFEQTSNNLLSAWEADTISPTGMHILCIALSQKSLKITKVSYLLHFFNKSRALVLFLFELSNVLNYEILG